MAKQQLGTKRVDPETGKKFYDLNRDPIISPYTGISYPRSYFEATAAEAGSGDEEIETEELDAVLEKPSFISLEDAEDENKTEDVIPDLDDDVVLDDDDTFLPHDDEDDEDVSDILGGGAVSDDDES
ncbi:TIGR02300 family protein [Bartonella sp. DGB2]|uniref:TIGR02300 family protein n=1 Tax=Bartonella sp. DGB2 TaxID=3388426 RepID=UPI003990049B